MKINQWLLAALAWLLAPLSAAAATDALWTLEPPDEAVTSTRAGKQAADGVDALKVRIGGAVAAPSAGDRVTLPLPDDIDLQLDLVSSTAHGDGIVSLRGISDQGVDTALLTFGGGGVFGSIDSVHGRYMVSTDASGTWLLRLDDPRLRLNGCDGGLGEAPVSPVAASRGGVQQIDVMFLYTPDMVERYPGGLLATRIAHVIAVGNQALVNSETSIVVRLVHREQIPYLTSPSNFDALAGMRAAVSGETVPGLTGLDALRAQHGADIVVLFWPADIETRGACGVAYLPDNTGGSYDPLLGVQVTNDGISNWSVCDDYVFVHELGHNLGALHQRFPGEPAGSNYAYVVEGVFNTIMGSFGSAQADRFRRIGVFSNPDILCAGIPCGSLVPGEEADNAGTLDSFAPVIAGYAAGTVPGVVTRPPPSNPDSDGDGVSDWLDPFPFDPHNGNPPVDPPSPPFTPLALLPGTAGAHQFEILVANSGNDQVRSYSLDGRPIRVVAAPVPIDPRPAISEFSDLDVDGEGRLYLLASADVRRFSRGDGRLLDVFLNSAQPLPRQLLTGFSRAMGFSPDRSQVVVLGDYAVERYALNQTRVSFLRSGPDAEDPETWEDYMLLPLRAFAYGPGNRFYLAEGRHKRIFAFDATTGARVLPDVAAAGAGLVQDPRDLVVGPDGWLYLADGASDRILRFNPASPGSGQVFVAAGAGGLSFARALAFGPDGRLYVVSRDNNRILRYDGATGAFQAVVVDGGGLDTPETLLITTRLDLIFADGFE